MWRLAVQNWVTEQGAQGAVVLLAGLWLLFRELHKCVDQGALDRSDSVGNLAIAITALVVMIVVQIVGRLADLLLVELAAVYGVGVALLYARGGLRLCRRLWFPLIFLLAALPVPSTIMSGMTQGLKLWVSAAVVALLSDAGVEVARSGASLFVDQYELLVEAACSGMNSLLSLSAIGVLYAYLQYEQAAWRAVLLAIMAAPIALLANIVRVIVLLLLVHARGVYILDTPLHVAIGLSTFAVALLLLLFFGSLVDLVCKRSAL